MAEFVRVMNLKRQICKKHPSCYDCPLERLCTCPSEEFTEEDAREMEAIVINNSAGVAMRTDYQPDYQRGFDDGYILGRHNALVEVRKLVQRND